VSEGKRKKEGTTEEIVSERMEVGEKGKGRIKRRKIKKRDKIKISFVMSFPFLRVQKTIFTQLPSS
jgi:hypothetical protein